MAENDKSQISLRLPTKVIAQFDQIAQVLERDRTWVMLRAMKQYLEQEGAELLQDAQGLSELDRGEAADFDEMLDKASSIIDAAASRNASRDR
ncbi:ribbon-helix-helix protein, CopG family [Sinorhizobium sp. BG8]|uniref:CopG family ribbon-helix-helix protein n=1 Tax=Sinorhizobium sp. BG8 TaxID=2613773 RepID=UPI00193E2562|nr:ribbon-helix-helix protein, CopG family [Sinorhizobium sp. BG8]QRM55724.1 ribbon-helix-helix protein, CopG family [Sinorhizobium sp. BG8]